MKSIRLFRLAVFGAALSVAPGLVFAQGTAREALAGNWNDIARKLVAMAQEFPEDKYDFRPTPEVRTFAQQMLHVAFWNQYLAKKAQGQNPDGKLNELPRAQYKTKAAVVKVVRSSSDEAAAVLKSMTDEQVLKTLALWDGFTEHNGEHYGQLVMYFRLNHLVPPESRPAK